MKVFTTFSLVIALTQAAKFKADIRADSNRDGKVDVEGSSDLGEGKETWAEEAGALFLPNIADSSGRCRDLYQDENEELVKCNDASDDIQRAPKYLAPLRTIPIPGLSSSAVGRISVLDPVARKCVRIFQHAGPDQNSKRDETFDISSFFKKPYNNWPIVHDETTFSAAELAKGLQLGIDARGPRGHLVAKPDIKGDSTTNTVQPWDGRVTIQFTVTDGETNSTDSVMLRVAPLVTQNHLQHVTKLFTFKPDIDTQETFNGIKASAEKAGIKDLVQVEAGSGAFVQDIFETMHASIPGPDGTAISLPVILPAPMRSRASLVAQHIRSTGLGMVTDVLPPWSNEETLDSMGNLETIPPYEFNGKNFSAGRIVIGANQTGGRVPLSLPFLQAQEIQDPLLVDTTWLEVQHVDEFLQFLPAKASKTSRKWHVMVSDPLAALELLQDARANGHGNDTYSTHPPRNPPRNWRQLSTLDYLLSNTSLAQTNKECARRIEGTIKALKRETGITDDDIFRVPVLYYRVLEPTIPSNGDFQVGAAYPSAINGLVLTDSLYIAPKQWGPLNATGTDILQHAVEQVYEKAGYKVDFVDDWDFHKRKGDIHCATNALRELPTRF